MMILAILLATASPDEPLVAKAQAAVTHDFRDPGSAQFRAVKVTHAAMGLDYVCGEVNGKNAYGAYVGYRRFVYSGNGTVMLQREADYLMFRAAWMNCTGTSE